MLKKDLISIVIIVNNEGKNISNTIIGIERFVKAQHEIIIVYDFDTDDTIPVVKLLQKRFRTIHLVKNKSNPGVITAIKTGLNYISGNLTVIMTPDRADDPKTIEKMYKKIKEGYDIASATRYAEGGKRLDGINLKFFFSKIACLLAPLLLEISTTDITNGFKMYKTEIIKEIPIHSNGGWEFSLELIIKAHKLGYKIIDIPTISKSRIYGISTFKLLKWLPKYIKWYIWGIAQNITSKFEV